MTKNFPNLVTLLTLDTWSSMNQNGNKFKEKKKTHRVKLVETKDKEKNL